MQGNMESEHFTEGGFATENLNEDSVHLLVDSEYFIVNNFVSSEIYYVTRLLAILLIILFGLVLMFIILFYK